jgi:hypothetical protein
MNKKSLYFWLLVMPTFIFAQDSLFLNQKNDSTLTISKAFDEINVGRGIPYLALKEAFVKGTATYFITTKSLNWLGNKATCKTSEITVAYDQKQKRIAHTGNPKELPPTTEPNKAFLFSLIFTGVFLFLSMLIMPSFREANTFWGHLSVAVISCITSTMGFIFVVSGYFTFLNVFPFTILFFQMFYACIVSAIILIIVKLFSRKKKIPKTENK